MKKAMLAMMLLAGTALAGPRFAVGIGFGVPAPVAVVRPACPGPGYLWIDGYYGPTGIWVPGFWRAPAFGVAIGPRFVGPRYYAHDFGRHDFDRHDYDRGRDFRHEFRR